jgi:hypothetical protein
VLLSRRRRPMIIIQILAHDTRPLNVNRETKILVLMLAVVVVAVSVSIVVIVGEVVHVIRI